MRAWNGAVLFPVGDRFGEKGSDLVLKKESLRSCDKVGGRGRRPKVELKIES